jgi:hypothetical protein
LESGEISAQRPLEKRFESGQIAPVFEEFAWVFSLQKNATCSATPTMRAGLRFRFVADRTLRSPTPYARVSETRYTGLALEQSVLETCWRDLSRLGGARRCALHYSCGAARCVRSHIPGALSIRKGAVPDRARGLGHMAPTYFGREPGIERSDGRRGSARFLSFATRINLFLSPPRRSRAAQPSTRDCSGPSFFEARCNHI